MFALPLLFLSCLYTRTISPSSVAEPSVKIVEGSAVLKIHAKINENVYSAPLYDYRIIEEKYNDRPQYVEDTVSKNETKYLSAGDEYTFTVVPSEVVTINITSSNESDVKVFVSRYGEEKGYTVRGTDRLGLFLAFQNR